MFNVDEFALSLLALEHVQLRNKRQIMMTQDGGRAVYGLEFCNLFKETAFTNYPDVPRSPFLIISNHRADTSLKTSVRYISERGSARYTNFVYLNPLSKNTEMEWRTE